MYVPLPLRNFDQLIPDAPELIHSYLEGEQDASCKRNAFMMLIHVDRVRQRGLESGLSARHVPKSSPFVFSLPL